MENETIIHSGDLVDSLNKHARLKRGKILVETLNYLDFSKAFKRWGIRICNKCHKWYEWVYEPSTLYEVAILYCPKCREKARAIRGKRAIAQAAKKANK